MESGNKKSTLSLREFINKAGDNRRFEIPDYQRGYVWGKKSVSYADDSVTNLTKTLILAYSGGKKDVFLQGLTVTDSPDSPAIVLIDGQQRTTFFSLLLRYLNSPVRIPLTYSVRRESDNFFRKLDDGHLEEYTRTEPEDDEFQDIFYFRKTLWILHSLLGGIDKKDFAEFILDHVKFMYVTIPSDKASDIFTMMNGQKKMMLQEELVKAELLRNSSLQILPRGEENIIRESENIHIRQRLAREWDKWLYWWNDNDVRIFFQLSDNPRQLGWLLPLVFDNEYITLDHLKNQYFNSEESPVKLAKNAFRKFRLIQKKIEDAYNDPVTYNYIGAILCFRKKNHTEIFRFMKWYFIEQAEKNAEERLTNLRNYFDLSMLALTHNEIVKNDLTKYEEKRNVFRNQLDDELLYRKFYETAAHWLLRRNVLLDSEQRRAKKDDKPKGVKFNFSIWDKRSLEHIIPKSMVFHTDRSGQVLNWQEEPVYDIIPGNGTDAKGNPVFWRSLKTPDAEKLWCEHSIGNLVLLYCDENSSLGKDDFETKKKNLFTNDEEDFFQSRHLLHSMGVFGNSSWTPEDVIRHKKEEIEIFDRQFKLTQSHEQEKDS